MINLMTCEKLSATSKPLSDWQNTAFDAAFYAQETLARQHVGRTCPKLEDVDTVFESGLTDGVWQYRYCERGSANLMSMSHLDRIILGKIHEHLKTEVKEKKDKERKAPTRDEMYASLKTRSEEIKKKANEQ